MIVKNKLLNFKNKYIYQDNDCFLFSLDSVLLANFVTIKLSDKKIIDLCCGNAPIPMLLSFRTNARIFGVEIQKNIYDLAIKSINENGMDKQINILNDYVPSILSKNYIYDKETIVQRHADNGGVINYQANTIDIPIGNTGDGTSLGYDCLILNDIFQNEEICVEICVG